MSQDEKPTDEASEAAYLRTAFLERLAHELRGPAGVIQGALHEIERALGDDALKHEALFAMAKRGVGRILRSADRLEQTGQLVRGDVELQRDVCDLPTLLRVSVEDARALENRRHIEVEVKAPKQPVVSSLDARWMKVVFHELTSNAIRHARKRAEVRLIDEEAWITIAFVDDNPDRVTFEPIRFRSSQESRGLGLALAIVRDVVVAHGGELAIGRNQEGGEDRGAEVRLRIPRDRDQPEAQAVAS